MDLEITGGGEGAGTASGGEGSVGGAASPPTGGATPGSAGVKEPSVAEAAGLASEGNAGGQSPKYTPNFKYKVTAPQGAAAAKMEKEIPEWARPFITSQDLEKNVRELFEKSEGIDAVKQHRDQLVSENTAMREQWAPVIQNVQTVVGHLKRDDLDSFFESVNLPEEKILRYALYRLQLRENPQALQTHEQTRRLQLENQDLQTQLQHASSGSQNIAVQMRTMQLDSQLLRPEIQGAAQAFDTRIGRPGSFRDEVIKRGKLYASMGQDVTVEQATNEVLQLSGWNGQNPLSVQGAQDGQGMGGGQEPKPTFPSIKGRGTSPAKVMIKSTAQLRELYKTKV